MKYLIYYQGSAFYTEWYDHGNNYMDGMIVFDLGADRFTTDGLTWLPIEEDHL